MNIENYYQFPNFKYFKCLYLENRAFSNMVIIPKINFGRQKCSSIIIPKDIIIYL